VLGLTQVPAGRTLRFAYGTVTRYGPAFQAGSAMKCLGNFPPLKGGRSYNPGRTSPAGLGYSAFARLLTESLLLSFPGGNEMFQFPPLAPGTYGFSAG
jgi:hypothetical protein